MSDLLTLKAQKRELSGKGAARKLRATGFVPGVFYTRGGENKPFSVNERDLLAIYGQVRRTRVFQLEIADGAARSLHPAFIWDVDYFPVKNRIQHVDILGVALDEAIKLRIPMEFTGVAKGIKMGGQLEIYRETVPVIGKPLDLPQKIAADVSHLDINDSIRVKDITLPAGLKMDLHPDTALAAVLIISETAEQEKTDTDSAPAE